MVTMIHIIKYLSFLFSFRVLEQYVKRQIIVTWAGIPRKQVFRDNIFIPFELRFSNIPCDDLNHHLSFSGSFISRRIKPNTLFVVSLFFHINDVIPCASCSHYYGNTHIYSMKGICLVWYTFTSNVM